MGHLSPVIVRHGVFVPKHSNQLLFLPTELNRKTLFLLCPILASMVTIAGCTQESQNKFGRAVQNWTGTAGVLDVYAGEKLVNRFINIDKLSTAVATQGDVQRPYRFGYGIYDTNQNLKKDPGEQKVYFEFSDYSTSYIFYENPVNKGG